MGEDDRMAQGRGDIRFDWRGAVLLVAIAVAFHVLSWVLLPFVLAAILAFLCEPVVRAIERRTGAPRWLAGVGVWVVLFAIGAAIAVGVGVSAVHEVSRLARHGPDLVKDTLVQVLGPKGVEVFGVRLTPDTVDTELKAHVGRGLQLGSAARVAGVVVAAGVGVGLFAALSFYLMLSGPSVARGALWLIPPAQRGAVQQVAPKMLVALRRFYVGVVVIVIFTALAAWIGYGLWLHVPDAGLLALALGVLETVPAIGPTVSAMVVGLIALQTHNPGVMALMVGYAIALRLVIDDLVAPPVLGRSVTVHPAVIMLAYALGAVLFGVTGLLLAVPAAACVRIWLEAAYGDTASAYSAERFRRIGEPRPYLD
jgi:predicted PurR-regulated permease PerM